MDVEDLFSEGCIGIQKAASRYVPGFDNKFSTYAIWWIKQAIKRALGNQSKTIRTPIHQQAKVSLLKKIIGHISSEIGREPTDGELAEELGIPVGKIAKLRKGNPDTISLDAPIG